MSELDELALLKERAKKLNITFSNNIGLESLKKKIEEALGDPKESEEKEVKKDKEEIDPARKRRIALAKKRKEAKQAADKLIRIRLTCMNPAKKEWPGEIITVSNKLIGTQKKFIPFNMDDSGYHVPQMMLNVLQSRKFQQFYTLKLPNGDSTRKGRLVKEFAIDILPPLKKEEIEELAQAQATAGGV